MRDSGESGVPGVRITLTGLEESGTTFSGSRITTNAGCFKFDGLANGTYDLAEQHPQAMVDGIDSSTDADAIVTNDRISNIRVAQDQDHTENNFGESSLRPEFLSIVWFFSSSAAPGQVFREMVAAGEEQAGNMELAQLILQGAVSSDNASPEVFDDSFEVATGLLLSVPSVTGILANDSDPDGDLFTATLASPPSDGTVTLKIDGSFAYSPNDDFVGADQFTYQASDGVNESTLATVSIIVNRSNRSPVAILDAYATDEDMSLIVPIATGVLANDNDTDGDSLTADLTSSPTNGNVALNPDRSFTYEPNRDFNGQDSFSYVARDDAAPSEEVLVTITVNAINDSPIGITDSYSMDEDDVLNIEAVAGVLANDDDPDGDGLAALAVSEPAAGTLNLQSDGSFTYVPNANFNGQDTFSYQANDGISSSDTVTVEITVNPINDAPQGVAE